MKNKERLIQKINTALDINEIAMDDVIIGGCSDTVDGWLRCHYQTMEKLLEDIKSTIEREEVEF